MKIKKIYIIVVFIVLISIISFQYIAFAEQNNVEIKSNFAENTATIEFLNTGNQPIKSFSFWLEGNSSFISFKSKASWIGKMMPQRVLVFTSNETLSEEQSIKFEIKTNDPNMEINWQAVGENGVQIQMGRETLEIPTLIPEKQEILRASETGITSESNYRIIPKNLRPDSTIRIIGKDFGFNHTVDFFLNDKKINSLKIDKTRDFVFTHKIPSNIYGKINFAIKDQQGNEILQEHYLQKPINKKQNVIVKFDVDNYPNQIARGEKITISGTAPPSTQVISKIIGPSNSIWSAKSTIADKNGKWHFSFFTSEDFEVGQYHIMISDLTDTISKNFQIVLSKQIKIERLKEKFEPKEPIIFNVDATPNMNLKTYFVDSMGTEVSFIESTVPESGLIKVKYPTDSSTPLGTYFLFLFTDQESDVVSVGLGEYPKNILSSKMDKTNYKIDDTATALIIGQPSETVDLAIVDSINQVKSEDKVHLGLDGKAIYKIKIKDLTSGSYSIIISKGNHRTSNNFTVGFKSGITWLDYSFTKPTFSKGEHVSLFGKTNPNIILEALLVDPNGNIVTKKEFFSKHNGKFLIDNFQIPSDGLSGKWTLQIKSGLYSKNTYFEVRSTNQFSIRVSDIQTSPAGSFVIIEGEHTTPEQSVRITIVNNDIGKTWNLTVISAKDGKFSILWILPDDASKGSYLVNAQDASGQISQWVFTI